MKPRSFLFARLFVGGLVVCTALLTVSGIAAQYFNLGAVWDARLEMICASSFAGIAVFALATSQVAAGMALTLYKHDRQSVAFKLAMACMGITGAISVGGAHMGALVLGLDPVLVDIGGLLLAFVKPAMSFATEACIEVDRAMIRAAEAVATQGEFELRKTAIEAAHKPLPEAANDETEAPAQAPRPRVSPAQAARAFKAGMGTPKPARTRQAPAVTRRVEHTLPLSNEELQLAVDSLTADGRVVSIASVAKAASNLLNRYVPDSRVERHPARAEIFAAARAA